MTTGIRSDFKVYQPEFQSGAYEALSLDIQAFNAASGGTMLLTARSIKGDYESEAYLKRVAGGLITRRDPTSVAAVSAGPTGRRKPYPSDVSDEEWAFAAPYLALCREDAPQRRHDLREVFNAARWMVKTGTQWRYMPNHFPPWAAVYQQTQRWIAAGVFEAMVHDLRALLRLGEGRAPTPTAVVIDGRTLQSTPESGARASYDGHKRKKGSKLHMVVDTLGHLLTLTVTPAGEQERAQVGELLTEVQAVTSGEVELAYVDQGYTGETPALAAAEQGILLEVVRLPEAKRGFVLLPRRWVVERSFAWLTRFRRLARDFERLPTTLAGLHYLAFASLMLSKAVKLFGSA